MSNSPNLSTSTPWPEGAIPQHWVESLFTKMAYTYGVKFADQWRGIDTDGVKRHWAEALGVMSDAELRRGVFKLGTRDWPPTLPEFMKLCRPVVDPVVAYHEAIQQGALRERGEPDEWSCPAIFWAWKKIGAFDFTHSAYALLKPRWEAALASELAKEAVEPVPAQMLALPTPGKATLSVESARDLLADFKVKSVRHGVSVAADGKRWARNILQRRANGESLEIAQVENAEQALGIR